MIKTPAFRPAAPQPGQASEASLRDDNAASHSASHALHQRRTQVHLRRRLSLWLRERNDDGSDFLFNSSHGGRLNRSSFYRLWRTLGEAAGLPAAKLHPHIAKHTLGALLARQNASAFMIRQQLGHKSISSSLAYCTISDADAGKIAARAFTEAF